MLAAAERCFSQTDAELEGLIRTKLKFNTRWDFKEKIAKRDEAIKALRDALQGHMAGKRGLVEACATLESALRTELVEAKGEEERSAGEAQGLRDQVRTLSSKAQSLEEQVKVTGRER